MWFARWLEGLKRRMNQATHRGRHSRRRLPFRPHLEGLEARLAPVVNLSIANPAPFPEGDSGTSDMIFVVTRSGDLAPAVTVDYTTRDGTARAGIDYQSRSGTLTFAPNQTTATIAVPIIGNTLLQPNRSFTVELASPVQSATFAAPHVFATGRRPNFVAVGDFNGDGRSDLAVSNVYSNTVSVLLNTAMAGATTPSFAPQRTFATDSQAGFSAVADFNGDGRPDLAVSNSPSGRLSVLLNTTDPGATIPSFAPQVPFATGSFPAGVAAGDVNGDGRPDLVAANQGDFSVSVLLNTTPPGATIPSFANQQTFAVGHSPSGVVVVDLNGDGRLDLAAVNILANTISVLLSTTTPGAAAASFAPQQTFATGMHPVFLAAGDFNGDNRPDLVVNDEPAGRVWVLRNTTAPGATAVTFAPPQTFAAGATPTSVAVGDFNTDGRPDLAVANYLTAGTVSVLLGSTAAGATSLSFAPRQAFDAGGSSYIVAVGDFNNDGRPDLAVPNYNASDTVSVMLNTLPPVPLSPSFALRQVFTTGRRPYFVAVGDFNGDGRPDLAVPNLYSDTVSVLLNTTAPSATTSSFAPQQTFATGNRPEYLVVADFNGDGRPDLAVTKVYSNTVSVLLNTTAPGAGVPTFAPRQPFATGRVPFILAVGDFNRDSRPDLAVPNVSDDTVSVFLNTAAPGATTPSFAPQQTFAVGHAPFSVAVADFNGDGRPDLAVPNALADTLSVLLNATESGATAASFAPQQTFDATDPGGIGVADFNRDGRPDVMMNDELAGIVYVLRNTTAAGATTVSFAPRQNFAAGLRPGIPVIGDFNTDGRPDFVVVNATSAAVVVRLNTAAPGTAALSFAPGLSFAVAVPTMSTGPNHVAVGDFNNDGLPDITADNLSLADAVAVRLNTIGAITLQGSPATGTILDDDNLVVTAFTPTNTGFIAQFNRPFVAADLNLYNTQADNLGPADATVVGPLGTVAGSLVVNADRTAITFTATGGPLVSGNYMVTLRSASNGFHTPFGILLDGNNDGTPGDSFTSTFVVDPFLGRTVRIPDFTRGPGQSVDVPGGSPGLPLRLSDGGGVTTVTLILAYDPALLRLTGATPIVGASAILDTTTPGLATLTFSSPTPLAVGPVDFVRLSAVVPDDAPYASKEVLDLIDVRVNGSEARDDDGVHIVGYFGDTTASAGYSAGDAQRALRVAVGLDTGFAAFQLADPRLLADITDDGLLTATDATRILQEAIGIDRDEIPPLPGVLPPIVPGGPDPLLFFPKNLRARAGKTITVPLQLEPSDGLDSANFAIAFDTSRLQVVKVQRGQLTRDFDLFAVNLDADAGTVRVGLGRSKGPIAGRGKGSVLRITFRIREDAPSGEAIINLRRDLGTMRTQLNEGGLDLIPDPSNEAGDTLDGIIAIRGPARARHGAKPNAATSGQVALADLVFAGLARRRKG